MDLFFVFALHVLGFAEPALQEPRDKRTRAGEGIEDVHAFVREGSPELFLQDHFDALDDEVHDLHRGVDDAQLFDREGKRALEKLFVQSLYYGLLAFEVVDFAYIDPHGFVELLKFGGILFGTVSLQEIHHLLHGAAYGIIGNKGIFLEKGIEYRARYQML